MKGNTALARLREWIRGEIDERDSFRVPDLVKAAEAMFGTDLSYRAALTHEAFTAILRNEVLNVVGENRKAVARIGATYIRPERLEDHVQGIWGRWSRCYEFVGTGHVRVMSMSHADIVEASRRRGENSENELRWKRFYDRLEPKVPADGRLVHDVLEPDDVNEMWRVAFNRVKKQEEAVETV